MNSFELEVNDRIEVIVDDKAYKSLIMDVNKDDNKLKINLPVYEGEYLFKQPGEELDINIYSKSGRCYNFKSEVVKKTKVDTIPCYELSSPYNIKRIQRRNYFRVDVVNDTKYKIITGINDEKEIEKIRFNDAVIVNLSGGGIRLILKEHVDVGDILLVKIDAKDLEMLLKGEIVRVEIDKDFNKVCGIKFLDITEIQVDKIIEELFEIMRRQKELV